MELQLCTISVATLCLALVLPGAFAQDRPDLLTQKTLDRRRLERFKKNHPDHSMCWTRHGEDGFYSVVDAHNHFRPFGGPPVPWETYISWLKSHGILFSTMLGIGQKLVPKNEGAPSCCYYLHCGNFDYPVVPDTANDVENAKDYTERYQGQQLEKELHLILSATFPNLQQPENNSRLLGHLQSQYPGIFKWSGEINVFKHALSDNGFFHYGERVTEEIIKAGKLDGFFKQMEDKRWPTTLHSDLGCDNYDKVQPYWRGQPGQAPDCVVPQSELELAKKNYQWWKSFLGVYYRGFFDANNTPKKNFKKIQHLKIWDALLTKYPEMVVVWAHLGLSKELSNLHPKIHAYIIEELMKKHPNLHADVSWDVLSKQLLMNYDPKVHNISLLHEDFHEDFDKEVKLSLVDTEAVDDQRRTLEETWDTYKEMVTGTGSVSGPTHAMAIYLEMFHKFPERFVTGTDFVSSMGPPDQFPGLKGDKANGCMKDKANHARQVTDTSAINMFLSDDAFSKIVLGGNYFRINRIDDIFAPPPVCGDSVLPVEAVIGIGVGAAVLVIIGVVVAIVLLCCCRKSDDGAFIRVDGSGNAATSHV